MKQHVSVGLVGFGYIGKVHTLGYQGVQLCLPDPPVLPRLQAVLRRRIDPDDTSWREAGYQLATADPDTFFAQPLDIVDICTPNSQHREPVQRAIAAGMAVYCEKPLAHTLADARALAELAAKTHTLTHIAFVLRYLPAIRQMKALLELGAIGDVINFRARMDHGSYLNPNRPLSWRLQRAQSGGGAFMDLGTHLVDLVHYLLGDVATVQAQTRTVIENRPVTAGSSERGQVDVDDWALALLTLRNGAVGTVEVTRMAAGAREATSLEIYGRQGTLTFHASAPYTARHFDLKQGEWRTALANLPTPAGDRPLSQLLPASKYSQGFMTDIHLAAAYDFVLNVAEGKSAQPDFQAGLAAQEVVQATYQSAAANGAEVTLLST
ncbi:MAG: hypothetical protein DRI37_08145 [Chloroflexi bacterium]|nr:MAG: hypothetical protein DRI37_08145 [Chloroflexota bacterium]